MNWQSLVAWSGWATVGLAVLTWGGKGIYAWLRRPERKLTEIELAQKHARAALEATEDARRLQKERDETTQASDAQRKQHESEQAERAKEIERLQALVDVVGREGEQVRAYANRALEMASAMKLSLEEANSEVALLVVEVEMARVMAYLHVDPLSSNPVEFPMWPLRDTAYSRKDRLERFIVEEGLPYQVKDVLDLNQAIPRGPAGRRGGAGSGGVSWTHRWRPAEPGDVSRL